MASKSRIELAKQAYEAYAQADLSMLEPLLAEDYTFFSPQDDGLDRDTYLEVCWPNSKNHKGFEYVRLVEDGDDVIVTYDAERVDGSKFRNTEVITFRGDQMIRTEVYFGWDL